VVAIIVDVFSRCLCAQTYNIRLVKLAFIYDYRVIKGLFIIGEC
jgi:hypothetical protein